MAYTDILYEKKNGVAWITINRPEVRNAFRTTTVAELTDAFLDARWDPAIGVVVLTGAGDKAFCSGGDQKERGQGGYAPGAAGVGSKRPMDVGGEGRSGAEGAGATSRPFNRPMDVEALHSAIRHIPKPVIAMVNGFAVGGGHVLHVLCDLSIAADSAIFGQTASRNSRTRRSVSTTGPTRRWKVATRSSRSGPSTSRNSESDKGRAESGAVSSR